MAKRLFTQGLAVLFERAPTFDAIEAAILVPVLKRTDGDPNTWIGGTAIVVGYRPEVNGYVALDVVDRRWPDDMGDPKQTPELFAAWSMGYFGPLAFPGSLERARQNAWLMERPDGLLDRHRAFVRLRLSYVFGAEGRLELYPSDVDPQDELETMHALARRLLDVPGALLLFNPNADLLLSAQLFDDLHDDARAGERIPIDAWMNVRFYRLDGVVDGWFLMDSVGLGQLDRPDVEACYPARLEHGEVAGFVKNLGLYLAGAGDVIRDGDTLDGPGGRWRARRVEKSLVAPPRSVIRVAPDAVELPKRLAG